MKIEKSEQDPPWGLDTGGGTSLAAGGVVGSGRMQSILALKDKVCNDI